MRRRLHPLFAAAGFFSVLFVITILAQVALLMGDPRAPLAQFLEAQAGVIMGVEVGLILVTGLLAMALDRHDVPPSLPTNSPSPPIPPENAADDPPSLPR